MILVKYNCYFYRKNNTYEKIFKYEDKLLQVIPGLFIKSFRSLSNDESDDFAEVKGYKTISGN